MEKPKDTHKVSSATPETDAPQTAASGKKAWRTPQLSTLTVPTNTNSGPYQSGLTVENMVYHS